MNNNYKQFKMKKKMPDLQSQVASNNDYRVEVKRVKAKSIYTHPLKNLYGRMGLRSPNP
jgi:hypothetical protein